MLEKVTTPKKQLEDYRGIISDELYDEIMSRADRLRGLRVLQLNATSFGGGVAEILQSLVPLANDVGLSCDWQVIHGTDAFFDVTKYLHNAFQNGKPFELTAEQIRTYEKINLENAKKLEGAYDVIMIHDPQPAAMPFFLDHSNAEYIWRLHIDTSTCRDENWSYFSPFLAAYSACIFSSQAYVSENIPIESRFFIPPAIDPLHPKNIDVTKVIVEKTIKSFGIDTTRPLVTQVSRFDPWKDPIGVVEAYKIAKKKVPTLQLALVASMANDDPEGWKIYEKTKKVVGRDKDVYLILNNDPVTNDLHVNAIQRYSDIIIQKSLKEGFGLVVTEAMWKEKPVVGGDTVGIRMQIEDGENGYLVKNIEECAEKIVYLLKNTKVAKSIGQKAKESVREKYLIPRLLSDELRVYESVLRAKKL